MAYVYREYRSRGKPWCLAYKGPDGRLRREKTDAPTKELAKKLLAKRLVEVTEAKIAGVPIDPKPVTFAEFEKEYICHIEAKKTPQSVGRDRRSIKTLEAVFGHRKLKEITTGMAQKYVDDRMHQMKRGGKKPYKPATINRELMCLSAIFREAVKRGYAQRNPVRGVKQLPEDNIIVRYLTEDEEKRLLAGCTATLRPIVLCGLHTGMRRSEILDLQWQDVDLDQRLICVRKTKSKKKRYLPINKVLLETLKALPRLKDCPYVFANPESKKRWYDQQTAWEYALKRGEITNFRFHDLRHTFASRLVQAGVPLKAVMELLGHSNIQVTMRYAHLAPADLRRAVDVLCPQETATQPATQSPSTPAVETATNPTPSEPRGNGGPGRIRTGNQGIMSPLLYH